MTLSRSARSRLIARKPRRFVEAAFRKTAANKSAFTDADLDVYAEAIGRPGAAKAAISYYRAAFRRSPGRLRAQLRAWDANPINAPTMLIWGTRDTALGEELVAPHEGSLINGPFEIVRISESAHWVQQEAPERVNEALVRHLEPLL